MACLPYSSDSDADKARDVQFVAEAERHFSEAERDYLARYVRGVIFFSDPDAPAGNYNSRFKTVAINTAPDLFRNVSPIPDGHQLSKTFVHELTHPLLDLAAQDLPAGHPIIDPEMRELARRRAEAFAPDIIKECRWLIRDHKAPRHWEKFLPEERIAAQVYLVVDDGYYDLFGKGRIAKMTGRLYTKQEREYETGCNLRGLHAIEEAMTGHPPALVVELSGDILPGLSARIQASLEKEAQQPHLLNSVHSRDRANGARR